MPKISCPIPGFDQTIEQAGDDIPVYYVVVPDMWLGRHAEARDKAAAAARKGGLVSDTYLRFVISMALLDGFNLPGMDGQQEDWDLDNIDLRVLAWVSHVTLTPFLQCFIVPKAPLSPLPNGSKAITPMM